MSTIYKVYVTDVGNIYDPSNPHGLLFDEKLSMQANEPGSFEFTLPPSNRGYAKITEYASTIDVVENNKIIWTGRCIEISEELNHNRHYKCEGALAYFRDIVLPYKEYDKTTITDFFSDVIYRYNQVANKNARKFEVISFNDSNTKIWRKTDYENVWEILEDMILNAEGGYFLVSKASTGNVMMQLEYVEKFTEECHQTIDFGNNIVDITNSKNGTNIATDIVPICHYNDEVYTLKGFQKDSDAYKSDLNSAKRVRPNSEGIIVNWDLRSSYPRIEKVIEYDMTKQFTSTKSLEDKKANGTITQAETVELAKAKKENNDIINNTKTYMFKNAMKKAKQLEDAIVSIEVKVADLRNMQIPNNYSGPELGDPDYYDNLALGQRVQIISKPHSISMKLPIYEISFDFTSGTKTLTLGYPARKELTKIIKPNKSNTSYKKDNSKHTTSGRKIDEIPELLAELTWIKLRDDPYHINETIDMSEFAVALLMSDGSTGDDVTANTVFTIDGAPASGYTFTSRQSKTLVATYDYNGTTLTISTILTVSDSYIMKLVFTQTHNAPYNVGDTFDLSDFTVMGRRDDMTTVTFDNSELEFNIQDGITIKRNTTTTLVATYTGQDAYGGSVSGTTKIIINGVNDGENDDEILGPGEADSEGKRLRITKWHRQPYNIGDSMSMADYEVRWYDGADDQVGTVVTGRCKWNIYLDEGTVIGGRVIEAPNENWNGHVINGFEHKVIRAEHWLWPKYYDEKPLLVTGRKNGDNIEGGQGPGAGHADDAGRRLKITKTYYPNAYNIGDHMSMADYEVVYYSSLNDTTGTVVTGRVKWNIKSEDPRIEGGVVIEQGSDNWNGKEITGWEPKTLKAIHWQYDQVWDETPLKINGRHNGENVNAGGGTGGPGEPDEQGRYIKFTKTYDGTYAIGDHFDLSQYEVTFYDGQGGHQVVTGRCRYNIGGEIPDYMGGGVTDNPNDYAFHGNGADPRTLSAYYKVGGEELWDETPLTVDEDEVDIDFHARAGSLVYAAGTILSENNGSRTPFMKTNDGWCACLLGYDISLTGMYANEPWFGVFTVSTSSAAAAFTMGGSSAVQTSIEINGRQFYVRGEETSAHWGGSTVYTNPLGLPTVSGEDLLTINYGITEAQARRICEILEIY